MNKFLLNISALAILSFSSTAVIAQEKTGYAPIFITPYTKSTNTYTSRMPTIVTSPASLRNGNRSYTQSGRRSDGFEFIEDADPFEGTGFGRVRTEKSFYDEITKKSYGQYEYLALLKNRGNTVKLQQITKSLQQSGVFDPTKYQNAMNGTSQNKQYKTDVNGNIIGNSSYSTKPKQVYKTKNDNISRKVHNPEWDTTSTTKTTVQKSKPLSRRPIFLR